MATGKDGWIVWNSLLYRALNDIHIGDMYVVDGNIERYTVEMFYDELAHLIAEETEARIEADTSLHGEIVDESVARENADTTLQGNIDAEATARENADTTLQGNIGTEATARENADTTLQGNIDTEATARENADTALQGNIDAEATARENADTALDNRIDALAGSSRIATPEQFGAVGDGQTDDTLAVQAAINAGINDGKTVMLTNKYLVNTLLVNDSVEICGGGTLYTPPFRYDITTSLLNNDNRYFTTAHPEYYHPNTFITVGNWQALVVTEVNGNEIHVAPTYVENETDTVVSKAVGSKVSIHKQCFWIAKQQTFSSVVLPVIKNINIHDISIIGNQSDYSVANETVMDYRQNAHISAYSCEELNIHDCIFDVCQTNCVGIFGIQTRARITNNIIKNCKCANNNAVRDYLETAGAICFHYDSKFIVATNAANNCTIEGNIIDNCFEGIFMSAASYCNISNNVISNCTSTGITVYYGDYAFNCRNNIVSNNVIEYCSVSQDGSEIGAITLSGATQTVVANNNILVGTTGLFIRNSEDTQVTGNLFIAQGGTCIYFYSGNSLHVKSNTFNANNVQHILLFIHNGTGGAELIGNTHQGTPSNKYINLVDCTNVFISGCNIKMGTLSRFMTISQYITANHNVLVKDCYVSQGITETTEEANRVHYDNCVNYLFQTLSNTTTA